MNASHSQYPTRVATRMAGPRHGCHHRRLAAGALLVGLLSGFAQAQDGVGRLVAADAAHFLQHDDAVVRGEAALIVAAAGRSDLLSTIVALSRDDDEHTRQRALLALGYLPAPSAVQRLEDLLATVDGRASADGVAAAFALGSLPDDASASALAHILSTFPYGSWKRQHDTLVAMLIGMREQGSGREVTALRRLYDDESNHDAMVRALLLQLLLPIDRTIDLPFVQRTLERGSEPEATATLQWIANDATPFDPDLVAQLRRLASQSRFEVHRVAALAALTRMRNLPALDLAAHALRSTSADESAQGMRSMLAIGGASQRRELEGRVLAETDPTRKTALLQNFTAPPSDALADQCARLGADRGQPFALRTAAATVLARSAPDRAGPLLRDLFRGTTDSTTLPVLAAALQRSQPDTAPLTRLLDGSTELWQHPERWTALLATGHPEAVRQLLQMLEQTNVPTPQLTAALVAWRRANVHTPRSMAPLPDVLRTILGGDKRP